jgi:hypothetical protein
MLAICIPMLTIGGAYHSGAVIMATVVLMIEASQTVSAFSLASRRMRLLWPIWGASYLEWIGQSLDWFRF